MATEQGQEKEVVDELEEQIQVFEPVSRAVQRELEHPSGDKKTYIQKELGFLAKLRFFKLLSGTLRLASDNSEGANPAEFLQEAFGDVIGPDGLQTQEDSAGAFIGAVMRLVELVPDFIEESYVIILNVPIEEKVWAFEALETLDDETGIDILETFVAQNSKAIKRFFDKHLRRVGQRISQEIKIEEDTEQESETTTS